MDWIENTGVKPKAPTVHIKLNCDSEWLGMPIRFHQNPDNWDWQRHIGGIVITHYMIPEERDDQSSDWYRQECD